MESPKDSVHEAEASARELGLGKVGICPGPQYFVSPRKFGFSKIRTYHYIRKLTTQYLTHLRLHCHLKKTIEKTTLNEP